MNASKKSLRDWFKALYYIIEEKDCCSALGLKRRLGLGSYQTAWVWFQKLREHIPVDKELLCGRVEFDQISVGGRAKGKEREITASGLSDMITVLVAVECASKGSGRVRLQIAKDGTAEEVTEFLTKHVQKGTIIRTDGHTSIKDLTELGFYHERIVMSEAKRAGKSTKTERLEANLKRIFRVSRCLDRILMGTHMGSIAPWRLQGYLNTFEFMFDRKAIKTRFSIFEDLFVTCVLKKCRTYREIIADEKVAVGGVNTKTQKPKGREAPKKIERWWKHIQWPSAWPAPGKPFGALANSNGSIANSDAERISRSWVRPSS